MRSPQGYEEWLFVAVPVAASVVCLWLFRQEDRILRRLLWTPGLRFQFSVRCSRPELAPATERAPHVEAAVTR